MCNNSNDNLRWLHKVRVPYHDAIVTNMNNMREVEGVTYHLFYLFMGWACTLLVHGVKDDLSLGFEWVDKCSN